MGCREDEAAAGLQPQWFASTDISAVVAVGMNTRRVAEIPLAGFRKLEVCEKNVSYLALR